MHSNALSVVGEGRPEQRRPAEVAVQQGRQRRRAWQPRPRRVRRQASAFAHPEGEKAPSQRLTQVQHSKERSSKLCYIGLADCGHAPSECCTTQQSQVYNCCKALGHRGRLAAGLPRGRCCRRCRRRWRVWSWAPSSARAATAPSTAAPTRSSTSPSRHDPGPSIPRPVTWMSWSTGVNDKGSLHDVTDALVT